MRVLLTGGGGFVGHHVFEHLMVNTDWDVTIIDSFRHKGKTDRIAEVLENHPEWRRRLQVVTHDLTAPISDQLKYRIGIVDYIINMASESHVDRSQQYPVAFIKNNIDLMLNMLEYAREVKPAKFIQISTDEVFGPAPDNVRHREGEAHKPSNPYSASKAAQEDVCYAYWRTFKVPVIITNTMNIIGERQDPEKFVPMIISKIAQGDKVPVHASPEGVPGSRFYLHARNQADALLFLLKNHVPVAYSDGVDISRFNIVGERETDNLTLAQMIAQFMGTPLRYELKDFHSSRPGHDLRYALDGSKMASLGWRPPMPFETSLKKTVEWTLEHPEWSL